MKNIIKIISSALVATLVLSTVALAAPSTGNGGSTGGDSTPNSGNGGSTAGNSTPSTGNGGSTAGNSSTDNGNGGNPDNGSSNGGSSKRRSGGGTRVNATLTNVNVNVVGNKATVTWDTNPSAQGMLVYGPTSLVVPTNATQFYGYAAGTAVSGATTKHSHTFTMAPGVTYFVRPVAIVGARVIYGSETKVTSPTKATQVAAVGTIFDKPVITTPVVGGVKATTTATTSENTANVHGFGSKIGSFFKWIWNAITAPFCR